MRETYGGVTSWARRSPSSVAAAVRAENYELAAELRDQIRVAHAAEVTAGNGPPAIDGPAGRPPPTGER